MRYINLRFTYLQHRKLTDEILLKDKPANQMRQNNFLVGGSKRNTEQKVKQRVGITSPSTMRNEPVKATPNRMPSSDGFI